MTARRHPPTPLSADGLSKSYGTVRAVRDVAFTAQPGRVTGFLGANGAGKSTTLRMMLGLVRPDAGRSAIGGRAYRDLDAPGRTVGAVLDLAAAHPAMTARAHVRVYAHLGGHRRERIDEVLAATGLTQAADRRIGGYSTGMKQRLCLATALLGDPAVLVLDEPANGLDPAGIHWLRHLVRSHADAGGTVLLSSHQLADLEQVIDDLVLIDDGSIRWTGSRPDFTSGHASLETAFLARTGQARTPAMAWHASPPAGGGVSTSPPAGFAGQASPPTGAAGYAVPPVGPGHGRADATMEEAS